MNYNFLNYFVDWCHSCLLNSEEAQQYLLSRGTSPIQWQRHKIGYVASEYEVNPENDPTHHIVCLNQSNEFAKCDSCKFIRWSSSSNDEDPYGNKLYGKRIVGNIVLPLTTYSGLIYGVQLRSIREKNYDTYLIQKRPEAHFFGTSAAINHIWNSGHVWLVEGPFDQLIVEKLISPATLSLTTNKPSFLQFKFLNRFVKRVYCFLDNDKAGRSGFESIRNRFDNLIDIIDVKLSIPGIKDPGELWLRFGDGGFHRSIKDLLGEEQWKQIRL